MVYKSDKLPDDKDSNDNERKDLIFKVHYYRDKPSTLSFGTLSYKDSAGNKCYEQGQFNEQQRIVGIGLRKQGDKYKVIGDFANGILDDKNHFVIE